MTSPYRTPERTSEEMTFHDAEEKRQPVSLATVVGAMSGSDLEALDDNSDVSVSIADTESRESEGMTVAFKVQLLPPSRTPKLCWWECGDETSWFSACIPSKQPACW